MAGQLQCDSLCRGRQQRHALTQKDRDHGDLHGVHQPQFGEAAEERTASEEPHVLPRLRAKLGHQSFRIVNDRDVGVVLLPECAREDEDLHARRRAATTSPLHRLESPATHEHRVELAVECFEIDLRVHHDPIRFPVRTGDESVQAHRNLVANPAVRMPRILGLAVSGFPRHVSVSK